MEVCKLNFCEINRVESGECRNESGEFRVMDWQIADCRLQIE
jgi:hypothetical protein